MTTRRMSRLPSGPYEERVDFERIAIEAQQRTMATDKEFIKHLRRVERLTLAWVDDTLGKRKLRLAIPKFRLPGQPKLRAILRSRMNQAARRGALDVAKELDEKVPAMKMVDLSRVRARADVLLMENVNWLETNLKRVWAQAMLGARIDRAQLRYLTQQQFAKFAGWTGPTPP